MANIDDLTILKRKIDAATRERERLHGELRALKKQFEEMGFNSLDEVNEHIKELRKELATLNNKVEKLRIKLEELIEKSENGDGA